MKAYDVCVIMHGKPTLVIAESMSEAETIFKKEFPYHDIKSIVLNNEDVLLRDK